MADYVSTEERAKLRPAQEAAEKSRSGMEAFGVMLIVLAVGILAVDLAQRGVLNWGEAVVAFLLVNGLWLAISHRKGA